MGQPERTVSAALRRCSARTRPAIDPDEVQSPGWTISHGNLAMSFGLMRKGHSQLAVGHSCLPAGTLLLLLLLLGAGSQQDSVPLGNTSSSAGTTPASSTNTSSPSVPSEPSTTPAASTDEDNGSCPAADGSLPTDAALGPRSRAALRSCPAVVEFGVSSVGPRGVGANGGPQSICASIALMNNGQAETLGWQLVWNFVDDRLGVSAVSGAALVPDSGLGSPTRIVNGYDSASVPANGGITSLTLLLGATNSLVPPNASGGTAGSGGSSNDTTTLSPQPWVPDLVDVSFNGRTCTKLPSSSFLLRDCARPLLASTSANGSSTGSPAAGGSSPPTATPNAAAFVPFKRLPLCVSVFCCSDVIKSNAPSPLRRGTPTQAPASLTGWGFVPASQIEIQNPDSFMEIQQALNQLAQTVDLKGLPQSLLSLKDIINAQLHGGSTNSSSSNASSADSARNASASGDSGGSSSNRSDSSSSGSAYVVGNGTRDRDNETAGGVVRYDGGPQNSSNSSFQAAAPGQELPAVRRAAGPPDDDPSDTQTPEAQSAAQPATLPATSGDAGAGQQGTSPPGSGQSVPASPVDSSPLPASSAVSAEAGADATATNGSSAGGDSSAAPIAVVIPSVVGAALLVLLLSGIAITRQRLSQIRSRRLTTIQAGGSARARTELAPPGAGTWTPGLSCLPSAPCPGPGAQAVTSPPAASAVSWLPDLQWPVSTTSGGSAGFDAADQARRAWEGAAVEGSLPAQGRLHSGAHPGGGGAQPMAWAACVQAARSSSSRVSDGSRAVGCSSGDGSWADEEKGLSHVGSRSSLQAVGGGVGERPGVSQQQGGLRREGSGGEVWRSNLLSVSSCQLFGAARGVVGSAPELPGPWGLFRTATAPERQVRVERLTTLQRGLLAWERRAGAAAGAAQGRAGAEAGGAPAAAAGSEAAGIGGEATARPSSSSGAVSHASIGAAAEHPCQPGGYVPPLRAIGAVTQQGGYIPPIRPVGGRRSHDVPDASMPSGTGRVHSSVATGGQLLASEVRRQLLTLQGHCPLDPAVREARTLSDPRPLLHPDGGRGGTGSSGQPASRGGCRGEGDSGSRQVPRRVNRVIQGGQLLEPRASCSYPASTDGSGGSSGSGDGGGGGAEGAAGDGSALAGHSGSDTMFRAPFVDFKPSDLVLLCKLGSGAFGTVHKARVTGSAVNAAAAACLAVNEQSPGGEGQGGLLVAVKMVPVMCDADTYDGKSLQALKQEVQVLSQLSHPHIIQFLGAYLAPPNICIVEELAEGGSLHSRLHGKDRRGVKLHPPLTLEEVLQLGTDVASAMAYLHPQIVHRDLKPQNVLLDRHGRAKLCDFGLVKIKDRTWLSTKNVHAGTTAFMAPEQFDGQSINEKVDVYAFSMLLYECITSTQVWSDLDHPMQIIFHVGVHCRRPPLPDSCPADLASLIRSCWADDPAARPGFDEVLHRLQVMQARVHP